MNKLPKVICITTLTTLLGACPALAQSHDGNANGGTGASMNGGSGSDERNEGPTTGSATPANSSSRTSNSTSSNTNGHAHHHGQKHHHSKGHTSSSNTQNGQ